MICVLCESIYSDISNMVIARTIAGGVLIIVVFILCFNKWKFVMSS